MGNRNRAKGRPYGPWRKRCKIPDIPAAELHNVFEPWLFDPPERPSRLEFFRKARRTIATFKKRTSLGSWLICTDRSGKYERRGQACGYSQYDFEVSHL